MHLFRRMKHQNRKISFYGLLITLVLICNPSAGWSQQITATQEKGLHFKISGDHSLLAGNTSVAIAEYQKALKFIPQSSTTYFNLAIAFYAEKNIDGTASALEEVLKLNPKDIEAHYNLACLRIYQRNLQAAKLHFEQAKLCCLKKNSTFLPSIQQGLEFLAEIQKYDAKSHVPSACATKQYSPG